MRQTYRCVDCGNSTGRRIVCDACLIERGVSRVVVESTVAPIEVTPWTAEQGPALTLADDGED